MRVAYVCADPGVPVFGTKGCSIHVQEILQAFLSRGDDVQLLAARLGGATPSRLRGVQVVKLPVPTATARGSRELALVNANRRLTERLREAAPFDLVYERYSLWSFAAMGVAEDADVPGILEVNAPLIDEQSRYRQLVHRGTAESVARDAFRHASSLIAVSEGVADYLNGFSETEGRVHVIPNGVDPHRFSPHVTPCDRRGEFVVGFVGSLKSWHGVDRLITAFQRLIADRPGSRLVVVGDGTMRQVLSQHVEESSPEIRDAVHFTGAVPPEEIPGWLASVDVAVAPYPPLRGFYFSPLKVYEYMAAGRAVIASRIGQLENLIVHGENGLLYDPGDTDGLTALLRRLHDDPAARQRLGANARETILREHSWDHVLERTLQTVGCHRPADVPVIAGGVG